MWVSHCKIKRSAAALVIMQPTFPPPFQSHVAFIYIPSGMWSGCFLSRTPMYNPRWSLSVGTKGSFSIPCHCSCCVSVTVLRRGGKEVGGMCVCVITELNSFCVSMWQVSFSLHKRESSRNKRFNWSHQYKRNASGCTAVNKLSWMSL